MILRLVIFRVEVKHLAEVIIRVQQHLQSNATLLKKID